jgi:hypothetical protein
MPLNLEYGYFGADLCICIGNPNFFGQLVLLDNVPASTVSESPKFISGSISKS